MYLTKSKYVEGMQCPKMLWMDEHMPEEAISKANPSILENDLKTGEVARSYFGDYALVPFDYSYESMCAETDRLMKAGVQNIAEATFIYEAMLCRVDILHFNGTGYDIVEVKSSTKIRDEYYLDVSFQYYVLTKAGVPVDHVYLMYVNNEYYRYGELNRKELFCVEDVTDDAKALSTSVKVNADEFLRFMSAEEEPKRDIGLYCESPFECDYREYCTRFLPCPSVLDVAGLLKRKKYDLYDKGIVSFEDLAKAGQLLRPNMRRQIETELYDAPDTVNKDEDEEETDADFIAEKISYKEFINCLGVDEDSFPEDNYWDFLEESVDDGEVCAADEFEEWFGITVDVAKYSSLQNRIERLLSECEEDDEVAAEEAIFDPINKKYL